MAAAAGAAMVTVAAGLTGALPAGATAAPDVALTPAHGLLDHQDVAVAGAGFLPGEAVEVAECLTPGTPGSASASCDPARTVPADPSGAWSATVRVYRFLAGASGGRVDCAQPHVVPLCGVQARGSGAVAFAPADFASGATQPSAAISVKPFTRLTPSGRVVSVLGTGFVPGDGIDLGLCSRLAPGTRDCTAPVSHVVADGSGAFSTTVTIENVVTSGSTTFACAHRCALRGRRAIR